jgi:hypothetical protein
VNQQKDVSSGLLTEGVGEEAVAVASSPWFLAMLRSPEMDKWTHRRGEAARGSFLRDEVAMHGGIEGGDSAASFRAERRNNWERVGAGSGAH